MPVSGNSQEMLYWQATTDPRVRSLGQDIGGDIRPARVQLGHHAPLYASIRRAALNQLTPRVVGTCTEPSR